MVEGMSCFGAATSGTPQATSTSKVRLSVEAARVTGVVMVTVP